MSSREPGTVGVVHTASSPCRCHASLLPGLRALGYRAFAVDADALPGAWDRLVTASAVFDQTDTLRGEGWLRALVRYELERAGARLVGPTAAAAALADDKAAARVRLAAAGVPVPPGVVLRRRGDDVPARLAPPFVVKGAHEHGSRGLVVAETRSLARAAARRWVRAGSAAVVEELVEGEEVTLTLVGRPLRALPPVAVALPARRGPASVLTFGRKWTGFSGRAAPAGRLRPAALPPALARRLRSLGARGARALGLTGLVRFDVRISPEGRPFVLEANPRPSLERGADVDVAASAAGMSYVDLLALLLDRRASRRGATT